MTWPPSNSEWVEILRELQAEASASARATIEAAVREYLSGSGELRSSAKEAKPWERLKRQAASKTVAALCDSIRKLHSCQPLDSDAERLLALADQLQGLSKRAGNRAFVCRPRSKKKRLYAALIRAWTDAGGVLGASEEGPLQRFLRQVLGKIGLRLTKRGIKAAIKREQERRSGLNVRHIEFGGQFGLTAGAFVIDSSGREKDE